VLLLAGAWSCGNETGETPAAPPTEPEPDPGPYLEISGGSVETTKHHTCAVQDTGDGGFVDGLAGSGLSFMARTNAVGLGADGVVAEDLDGDGCADLVFCQIDGLGEVYWNLCADDGSVRFEKGSGDEGIFPSQPAPSSSISSADVDGDGWLDLLLLPYAPGRLLINNRDRTFREASAEFGLASEAGYTPGATFSDVDGDGDLDLLVLRATDCSVSDGFSCAEVCSDGIDNNDDQLLDCADPQCEDSSWCTTDANGSGAPNVARGSDPPPPPNEEGPCSSAGAPCPECSDGVDNDADGLVDCEETTCDPWCNTSSDTAPCCLDIPPTCADPNEECPSEAGGGIQATLLPNQLWLNEGGTGFVQVTTGALVEGVGHTLHAAWLDFDGDGDPDLLELNDEGVSQNSRLWENLGPDAAGDLQWQERLESSGIGLLSSPMGVLLSDLDDDGLPDLWISEVDEVRVFRNAGGLQPEGTWLWSFVDVGTTLWVDPAEQRSGDVSWSVLRVDTQGDGRPEVFVSYGWVVGFDEQLGMVQQADRVFANDSPRGEVPLFRALPDALPVVPAHSTGAAIADFNRDGVPDIIARNITGLPALYVGKCTDSHRLVLHLDDPDSLNRFAIGARVEVEVGGHTQVQEMVGGGHGSFSASQPALYFGTGSAERIDRLRVLWPGPGGRETVVTGLCAHCLATVSP